METKAQVKTSKTVKKAPHTSTQLAAFKKLANEAGISFTFPEGFKELKAVNNENFSFDYALEKPGKDFEVWFNIQPLKQNWLSYEQARAVGKQLANPDSTYNNIGRAHAAALSGGSTYLSRTVTDDLLAQYNADAGKTYLINLLDIPETKKYKYALLISLQKNHTGNLLAVCLTNDKGPEFFKNINQSRNCIKFR